jgi:acyl-CoA thioester hydrolase
MLTTVYGVAHPWLCDAMGHMNVRHYAAAFDDASWQMLEAIGRADDVDDRYGWADVRSVTEYRAEVTTGRTFLLRSGVARIGKTSLTLRQYLIGADGTTIHAFNETTTVHFDLVHRSPVPLTDTMRQRLQGHLHAD